ncbi:hypothetical protein LIER_20193 [Lithospermum erythrorhizon]|uniref:Uncharacterized protein n=1 Tax=Lithospermum erythrorhizon TaxID=34254 RepID=A0AAV3QKK6_LITER
MEKLNNSTSILRTTSDQLMETMEAAMVAMKSPSTHESRGSHSRKSSRGGIPPSPGPSSGSGGRNTHIRKARSAQLKFDSIDDVSSGAALSRASSASLGLSFTFTGFTAPPDEVVNAKPFSDEDIGKFCSSPFLLSISVCMFCNRLVSDNSIGHILYRIGYLEYQIIFLL